MRIIHLDDHTLFQEGVRRCLSHLKYEIALQQYQYSHHAFDAIKECIDTKQTLDLIITDFTHMGQHGYDFAKSVREYETQHLIRIPILLLSMHMPKYLPMIQQGLDERVFDAYLPKSASCERIHETIEQLRPSVSKTPRTF